MERDSNINNSSNSGNIFNLDVTLSDNESDMIYFGPQIGPMTSLLQRVEEARLSAMNAPTTFTELLHAQHFSPLTGSRIVISHLNLTGGLAPCQQVVASGGSIGENIWNNPGFASMGSGPVGNDDGQQSNMVVNHSSSETSGDQQSFINDQFPITITNEDGNPFRTWERGASMSRQVLGLSPSTSNQEVATRLILGITLPSPQSDHIQPAARASIDNVHQEHAGSSRMELGSSINIRDSQSNEEDINSDQQRATAPPDLHVLQAQENQGLNNVQNNNELDGMYMDIDGMSYEELLDLEEQMGIVNTAQSEEAIDNGIKRHAHRIMKDPPGTCTICMVDYRNRQMLSKLECGHEYHFNCIKQWLLQKNLCPICKREALPK